MSVIYIRPNIKKRSRSGKSQIGGYFPPEVSRQVKIMAAEQGKTVQQLLDEGIHILFEKYGRITQ